MSAVAILRQSTGAYSLTTMPKIVLTNWTWLRPCCFMRASLVLVTPRHKLESGASSAACVHGRTALRRRDFRRHLYQHPAANRGGAEQSDVDVANDSHDEGWLKSYAIG